MLRRVHPIARTAQLSTAHSLQRLTTAGERGAISLEPFEWIRIGRQVVLPNEIVNESQPCRAGSHFLVRVFLRRGPFDLGSVIATRPRRPNSALGIRQRASRRCGISARMEPSISRSRSYRNPPTVLCPLSVGLRPPLRRNKSHPVPTDQPIQSPPNKCAVKHYAAPSSAAPRTKGSQPD